MEVLEWSGWPARTSPPTVSTSSSDGWKILLPAGPFDFVVSALAVHHLEGEGKADLYRRVAAVLAPAGRLVLADVVKPVNPSYVVTHIDPEVDHPSTLDENLAWLEAAGLFPEVTYTDRDLVVIDARTPSVS